MGKKYSHWLQLSSRSDSPARLREIEFRPLKNMWSPSAENWRLTFSSSISTSSTRMRCGNTPLVDVQSPTFKMVSSKLASLEVLFMSPPSLQLVQNLNFLSYWPASNCHFI